MSLLETIMIKLDWRGASCGGKHVDGVVHLESYPLYQLENTFGNWAGGRGTNLLDGDMTFYDICQNRDDRVMAVSPPLPSSPRLSY